MDVHAISGSRKPKYEEKVRNYGDLETDTIELIQAAITVKKFAYSPYSNFKVGAAFRSKCGRIFTGCNVESCSYTPTCCAERTAISKAVSEGCTEFTSGAVVAYEETALTTPCGVCRQLIMEFANEDISLYITKDQEGVPKESSDAVLCTSIYNLLPHGFKKRD
ncbi:cytidine deaminase-like [Teleopsis dalmanni]|uniref:cytidine deaminase-like n=1 Tax=Teleopsis dalmanni TaxID=139649 RepID=UPI0018CE56B5|nr:cytidine deaminase-like [Teleopsis dalmanni]